tara:strand:- start:490274 stop:490804 length:531 start_codon:yes stop_codon:yes gene_type:complete
MSPAWMMIPLQRYLRTDFDRIIRWDYPRVFSDLDVVTQSLARTIDETDDHVSIVAHSFGDWIVRSALAHTDHRDFHRLVSVCPVTTAVPLARRMAPIVGRLASELNVMASVDRAELSIPDHLVIDRSVIWAKLETLVRQQITSTRPIREREVWATHNSVLFQPNGWRCIRHELLIT